MFCYDGINELMLYLNLIGWITICVASLRALRRVSMVLLRIIFTYDYFILMIS